MQNKDAVENSEPAISIDACATILAELDSRSYHRSLIEDANNVTEKILQPMSFPWTHKVVDVARNIPCDIDEMIDIITADDGLRSPHENGNFGFGQYETGRRQIKSGESIVRFSNSCDSLVSATRRSSDPGIMEFSTAVLPFVTPYQQPADDSSVIGSLSLPTITDRVEYTTGENLLRCFEAAQALKKRKVGIVRGTMKKYKISVKVNSSSSRSSIFATKECLQKNHGENKLPPDLLETLLPIEVENGRKLSKTKSKLATEELGSYNNPELNNVGLGKGCVNRQAAVGRTRLIWTSNKSPITVSLLTGQKIENGRHKRPRSALLRVKVDGEISRRDDCTKYPKNIKSFKAGKNLQFKAGTNLQATLECDELTKNLLDSRSDSMKLPNNEYFVSPIIECVPDSSGSIHVVCTQRGTLKITSANSILKLASESKQKLCCTVCWKSNEGGQEVKQCIGCGLTVHTQCCLNPGIEINNEWKCSLCCRSEDNQFVSTIGKKSKRKSKPSSKLKNSQFESIKTNDSKAIRNEIKCRICHLSGGAMSEHISNGEKIWIHETCRIWMGNSTTLKHCTNNFCAVCGANHTLLSDLKQKQHDRSPLVKCAAAGCHIFVHPMCALVSSLMSKSVMSRSTQEKPSENCFQNARERDIELCMQYTLTFASVRGPVYAQGKNLGVSCDANLPVIFCGLHNPAREKSFYGLYSGGNHMKKDNVLRIPHVRIPNEED